VVSWAKPAKLIKMERTREVRMRIWMNLALQFTDFIVAKKSPRLFWGFDI
jgi:hypothetical protein